MAQRSPYKLNIPDTFEIEEEKYFFSFLLPTIHSFFGLVLVRGDFFLLLHYDMELPNCLKKVVITQAHSNVSMKLKSWNWCGTWYKKSCRTFKVNDSFLLIHSSIGKYSNPKTTFSNCALYNWDIKFDICSILYHLPSASVHKHEWHNGHHHQLTIKWQSNHNGDTYKNYS